MTLNTIRVEIVRDVTKYEALQKDWERLAANNPEASIYNQPKLLALWWKHFGKDSDRPFLLKRGFNLAGEACSTESLYILVAYYGERVVAILPLMLLKVKVRGEIKPLRCLHFLGDPILNPIPSILCLVEIKEQIISNITQAIKLSQDWDVLFLASLRQDFKILNEFTFALRENIAGEREYRQIKEAQFLRCWDRPLTLNRLRRIAETKELKDKSSVILSFFDQIAGMNEMEFSKRCISDITPRLRELMESIEKDSGPIKDMIIDVLHDISQYVPYVYQIISLPKTKEALLQSLSGNKRHRLKTNRQRADQCGFSVFEYEILSPDQFSVFLKMHRQQYPGTVHFNEMTIDFYEDLLGKNYLEKSVLWVVVGGNQGMVFFNLYYLDHLTKSVDSVALGHESNVINFNDMVTYFAMEKGVSLGFDQFSFRMGAERYKERFHPNQIPLYGFILSRKPDLEILKILPKQWAF